MISRVFLFFENIKNNTRLKQTFAASFILCFVTHAYAYFNSSFATDRYRWFGNYTLRGKTGAAMGKWFGQYLGFLDWNSYLPWLEGLIAIVYLAFSVYIICEVLDVKKTLSIWLIAGLMATDSCVIMAHFYSPQGFLLALITACISIWFWHKQDIKLPGRFIGSAVFISFSLGTYGSYTTVAPTVVVIACMIMLIEGEHVAVVLKRGGEYVAEFVAGMGVYYIIQRLMLKVQDLEMLTYMNEDRLVKGASPGEILYFVEIGYKNSIARYIGDYRGKYRVMPQWMAIVMLAAGILLIVTLLYKNAKVTQQKGAIILLTVLAFVFPMSAGAIYVMAFGTVHSLMVFTYVILYVGFVKLVEMAASDRTFPDWRRYVVNILGFVMFACTVFVIYKGVLVANMAYSRLDNLNNISNGIALRVLDRIESCDGFEGDEDVYFFGDVTDSEYFTKSRYADTEYLDMLDGIIGVDRDQANTFLYYTHLIMYMKENTETNLNIDYYDKEYDIYSAEELDKIESLPLFPADGSVCKINDTVVVKFANAE